MEGLFLPSKLDEKMVQNEEGIIITLLKNRRYTEVSRYPFKEVVSEIDRMFKEDDETDYR